jgi:hypothetical protein
MQASKKYDFVVIFDPNYQMNKKTPLSCRCGPVTIEMDIYMADYKPILSLMNYKYKYNESPLIVLK